MAATSDAVIAWLEKTKASAPRKPRVIYGWKNTSASMEIYTVGADGAFMDDLQKALAEAAGVQVGCQAAGLGAKTAARDAADDCSGDGPGGCDCAEDADCGRRGRCRSSIERSWPAQDEPLITFHLRKGVKWHDGEPFTSADAAVHL